MVPISLPTGKVYYARDIIEALELDFQELIANDEGFEVQDPFFRSSISSNAPKIIMEIPDISGIEEIPDINTED